MAKKTPAARIAKPEGPTFRVIKLADAQKQRMRLARGTTTNQQFIEQAVADQLGSLLEELAAIGIEPLTDAGPVRLPFSGTTLGVLKEASQQVSIPAVQLLRICLRRHAEKVLERSTAPARRGRKPAKKGGKRNG